MEKNVEANPPWTQPMPLFVASGSAKDTTWDARHGRCKKTVVVLSQCPWVWVREWADVPRADRKKNAAYLEFKQSATDLMMEQGFRKVFPELEKYVTFQELGTPLSTNDFLGTDEGECYGLAATAPRWDIPDLTPHTPVKNFLLTGQDVVTLGASGALSSGYLTANVAAGCVSWFRPLL